MGDQTAENASRKRKRKCRGISRDMAVMTDECREYFEREARDNNRHKVSQPLNRTATCFDISRQTVINIRKKLQNNEPFYDEELRERDMETPESFVAVVRETILDMYAAKEHVTLNTLLLKLQNAGCTRTSSWKWSRATLHRFLTNKMGYTYGKRSDYYQQLREDVFIVAQRIDYIKKVQQYRAEGRHIFYQDETWIKRNMTPTNVWLDDEGKGGLKIPQGKGERSIICHIDGESGFVDGTKLIFRGNKALKDSDYHTEMNSNVFLDWLKRKVLPAVPESSIIVVDRATYHTTLTEETKPAKAIFRKVQFAEWLVNHCVMYEGRKTVDDYLQLTRPELARLCQENKPKPIYEAEVLVQKWKCHLLLLPIGHPELNPIEMIWGYVKSYIAKHNVNFSLKEVEEHAHRALDSFYPSKWTKYIEHCVKIENKYLETADNVPLKMDS